MRLDHLLSKECCRSVPDRPLPKLNTGYSASRVLPDGCRTASHSRKGASGSSSGARGPGARPAPPRGPRGVGLPLFRFEGATPLGRPSGDAASQPAGLGGRSPRTHSSHRAVLAVGRASRAETPLENSRASTSIFVLQAMKSQRWMPWRLKPKKDVGDCDKPRGAVYQASIRGCPNGATRHPSWGATPA